MTESDLWMFTCEIPINKRVDILGLDEYDVPGSDYNDYLDDSNGDKVAFLLPASLIGVSLRFYSDNGTGTIDYGTPIFDLDTTGLPLADPDALQYPTLVISDYSTLDLADYLNFSVNGYAFIVFTPRLHSGTYKFGIISYNDALTSAPLEASITLTTRPDEITPRIVSFDPTTDTTILTADRNDAGATYNLYAGICLDSECTIDYTTPVATSASPTMTVRDCEEARQVGGNSWQCERHKTDRKKRTST